MIKQITETCNTKPFERTVLPLIYKTEAKAESALKRAGWHKSTKGWLRNHRKVGAAIANICTAEGGWEILVKPIGE